MENHEKVFLITGGTDGIGRITAEAIARTGAAVVIVGRNQQKAETVIRDIQRTTNNERVEYLLGDLSAQAEVRRVASEFRQHYNRLDVLINNAGAVFVKRELSRDGFEMTFALNHLAYFLMTHLLLDLLIASAPARIINVSSMAHTSARLNLDELQSQPGYKPGYNSWRSYGQSKLANLYFTYELARHLQGTGVTVNALHPGFVATNFGRSNGGIFNPLFRLAQVAAISPEAGAKTSIYLATSPEVEGVTGKYFDRCKPIPSSKVSYDLETARKLWDLSMKMTGLTETV